MKIIGVVFFALAVLEISEGATRLVTRSRRSEDDNCTVELCHQIVLKLFAHANHPCVWPCEVGLVLMNDNIETMWDLTKSVRSLHQNENQKAKRHRKGKNQRKSRKSSTSTTTERAEDSESE